ncbi:glycosyltransferase family 2 protein [Cellulomonas sp. APG4]|uniref:glycosyltransferase family 2 protein n=1 Tax=Cellulomonas sp. APG4 TaxID=1538656 RepID=UPI00137A4719|nr:glycosyltransferase family 2 protein [Cellulomonas sp. APG4]NCT91319.1 glycosyltransferase family 2 protein [Cellulomonas sp. APG4]
MSAPPADRSSSARPSDRAEALPGVSVILPVRDEEKHLAAAVGQVLAQDYAGPYEVVVAVGPSADRTREIADALAASDPRVTVVDNPTGRTPAALNAAIAVARHDVLVRVDGHSEIDDDYVTRAVDVLRTTGAANVGGRMLPVGVTPFEQAVARAMSSRLGIGSERFHTGGRAGPAATVYLGVFRRDALEGVGGFDESYLRAQDWELNHRLRASGETVWFDPTLGVTYRPRGSWRALARQFHRTGQWRRHVVRTYPETASPRYLAPPLAVVGVVAGAVIALVGAATGARVALVAGTLPLGYAAAVGIGSVPVGRGASWRTRGWLPLVIGTMHMAWGTGFLRGVSGEDARVASAGHYPGSARAPGERTPTRPATED